MTQTKFTGWRTPKELFRQLNYASGGFAVDAAADNQNHLTDLWYGSGGIAEDALAVDKWLSPAWCNPPYGKELQPFLDKILQQHEQGGTIVALLPAYTERQWWFDKVVPYADILFLVGRVAFYRPCLTCLGTGVEEGSDCGQCSASGIDPKRSQPRDASAICIYAPDSNGKVGWLDWMKE